MVDISLLGILSPILVFGLVWAIIYAVLEKTQYLKGSTNLHSFVAFVIALLFLIVPNASKVIVKATPWLTVLIVIITILFSMFLFLGWTEESFKDFLGEGVIFWSVFLIVVIILLTSLTQVFGPIAGPFGAEGESALESPEGVERSIGGEVRASLFHPRFLGAIFLLLVASFMIKLVSEQPIIKKD